MNVSNCYCIQGNVIGREFQNGPAGRGWNEDIAFTLNLLDRHVVAYSSVQHDADNKQGEREQAEMGRPLPLSSVYRPSSGGGDYS